MTLGRCSLIELKREREREDQMFQMFTVCVVPGTVAERERVWDAP